MIALYALLGFLVGILINLAADQLPRWRRLRRKPFCPECEQSRPWWAWSGTLAYLRLKRRCQECGEPISWRHPLVEIGTAALFAFLWQRLAGSEQAQLLLPYTIYAAIMVLVVVIDMEHRLILTVVMYPAWVLAFLGSFFYPSPYHYRLSLLGGAIGFGLLWLVYWMGRLFLVVMERTRGKDINTEAFGYGDVRLGVFIGLMVGFPGVLSAIFYAILLGGLVGTIYWFIQAVIRRSYSLFTPIPYGPFLVIGASIILFFGPF
ncbi:MAG: A24 family peptidase [Anaerolineae bacterium]